MMYHKLSVAGACLLAVCSSATGQTRSVSDQEIIQKLNNNPTLKKKLISELGLDGPPAPGAKQQPEPVIQSTATKVAVPRQDVNILNKNTPQVRNATDVVTVAGKLEPKEYSPCAGLTLLLRQDWKDIGIMGCPGPATTDKSAGAELSYAQDRVARNGLLTARGTAAVYFSSWVDTPPVPGAPYDQAFGAYLTVNRAINSSAAQSKADSDKLAFGGVVEFGFQTYGGANYFRLRGGVVQDRIKDTNSANVTAEFMPVYDDGTIHLNSPYRPMGAPFYVSLEPVFLVQYAAVTGAGQLLDFNDRSQALRIGPQLTAKFFPLYDATGLMARLSGAVTYHWAYETYSQRGISWFQSSLTYNVDEAGQIGITASYKKGRDEDTGTRTDIYKIGLTGKI
jgi:hypothetical protein